MSKIESDKTKNKQLRWSKPMSHSLLANLAGEAFKGNKPSSTFKLESFVRVAKEKNQKFKVDCNSGHVENHLKMVKKEWTLITTIRGKSGFGWDDNLKMNTAGKNVYDEEVLAHPVHEKYLNKKIKLYDEMQLVVAKDVATGLFAKSFVDIDSASIEIDSNLVDDTTEKETSESSVPSSQKRPHRKRKERTSDVNVDDDDGIKELATEMREIAKAMKDVNKKQLNVSQLYEEIMKVEGFSEIILGRAFGFLVQQEMLAKAFMIKSENFKRIWMKDFAMQYKE